MVFCDLCMSLSLVERVIVLQSYLKKLLFFISLFTYFMIFLQAVDWWSVGVLTYELLTGASPFTVEGEKNNQQEISRYV